MALITVGGADVIDGRVTLEQRGAWSARFHLDAQAVPTGQVSITAVGGFALTGTVDAGAAGIFADSVDVRIVGGAGGLPIAVSGSYRQAQLGDVLNAICSQTGEAISSSIGGDVLGVSLVAWTLAGRAALALDQLAGVASAQLGKPVHWRILGDGTLWMGYETWPAVSLPSSASVIRRYPDGGRVVIGVETPALLPGVALSDSNGVAVGNITAVLHEIEPKKIRTWAWS